MWYCAENPERGSAVTLLEYSPEIAAQWDPEKKRKFDPQQNHAI